MISIVKANQHNINTFSLDNYVRTQSVTQVWRKVDGVYTLVQDPYTQDWSLEKKRSVAQELMDASFITWLAMDEDRIVGFISLKRELRDGLMILQMMHVSDGYRGQKLGSRLFQHGVNEAVSAGARGLYISACSSKETIAFYRAMGAEITPTPFPDCAENEPYDLQMIRLVI